jgi:hypothetical protein
MGAYEFVPPNHVPIADASATKVLIISPNSANPSVVLDGSKSSDPDGDPLEFAWFSTPDSQPSTLLATGVVAVVVLPAGIHPLALVVSDGFAESTNHFTVEVLTIVDGIRRLQSLVNGSPLPHPQSLLATLDAALASVQRGDEIPAGNQLRVFQNKVQTQVLRLGRALSHTLVLSAQQVIDALDSPEARLWSVKGTAIEKAKDQ